ncbi:amidohydrolase family protein [Azospirillum sp. ST 5-10]|uniref:amidohydrolase family protein n=1 Tax=unclassified Azospirillum TaxID=2630922 RepID=UPI003F4A49C8
MPRTAITRTAITGVAALTLEADGGVLSDADILIEADRIVAVGPGLADAWPAATRIDGRGRLALPGLVNAHTHSPETLARGTGEGLPQAGWLATVWRRLDRLSPECIRLAVLLGAVEMLRGGVTAVLDHFRQTPMRPEAVEAAAAAYEEIGLRAVVAVMLRDAVDGDGRLVGAPWAPAEPAGRLLDLCEAAARRRGGPDAPVRIGVAPSAPLRATDALLAGAGDLSRRRALPFHTHVDETAAEAAAARAGDGRSATARLDALGALGPRASLAHCVWLAPGDADRIAAAGATVVHNPVSNLRLGAGVMPLGALRRAGVRVALGTDGAASNDGQSLLESVKTAAILHRAGHADPGLWPSAAEALRMAVDGGAAALGLAPGRLAPGARADIALFDLDAPAFVPLNGAAEQLVLAGAALRADRVLVAGREVLRDGRPTRIDEARLYAEARAAFASTAAAPA